MHFSLKSNTFDPLEFIRIAESLTEIDQSEASFRTAAGRTYYAAFLTAREVMNVSGGRHIHGRVIGALSRLDRPAGRRLRRLETLRALADYDTDIQDPLRVDWHRNYRIARRLASFILERLT